MQFHLIARQITNLLKQFSTPSPNLAPKHYKITIAHIQQYLIEVFYKLLELLGEIIVQVQRQFDLPTMFLNLK